MKLNKLLSVPYLKLNFKVRYLTLLLLFSVIGFSAHGQQERVKSFHSDINIDTTGVIRVSETISIYANGNQFKRGITRTLPTRRVDKDGNNVKVSYNILSINHDGKSSKYHTENSGGDKIIYVGEQNVFLEPGNYEYEIIYEVDHQIGFFDEYDELYWNVNGFEWFIPIDRISATVTLPKGASSVQNACYTGRFGDTGSNCEIEVQDSSTIHFLYDAPHIGENLTVAQAFTKGILTEPPPPPPPTFFQKFGDRILTGVFAFILLFYYVYTWRKFGVDPPKPTPFPQFNPPDELSPASVGLLSRGLYFKDLLTVAIVNLAIKGHIKINEQKKSGLLGLFKNKEYELEMLKDNSGRLPAEEEIVLRELFGGKTKKKIDGKYDSEIADLVTKFRKNLVKQWGPLLREGNNYVFLVFPILISAIYFFTFIFLLPLFRSSIGPIIFILFLVSNGILFLIYQWLIRKPAKRKLKLRSLIKGFGMFLGAAEEKQIQRFNPPELTPELFEAYLPYAIALNTDEVWGKRFQDLLDKSGLRESYNSSWTNYSGSNYGSFSHSMNSSLSNSIASASTQPSSSSSGGGWSGGSGGGGFSGGGGGGGGGGGW